MQLRTDENGMIMMTRTRLAVTAAAFLASASLVQAQSTQDHEAHHPAGQAESQTPAAPTLAPAAPSQGQGQAGMPMNSGGMMMGGDMAGMMAMMQKMRGMMQPGAMPVGMGAGMMRTLQHIEGEIAFQKAELHITDAQEPQWNAYADALRRGTTALKAAVGQAMAKSMQATAVPAAPDQIDQQIVLLSVHLDALRGVQPSAKALYAVLTDQQKKTADQLMAEHFMTMRRGAR